VSKFKSRLVNFIVNIALANNSVTCLMLVVWVLGINGGLPPVGLLLLAGAILNFLFFTLLSSTQALSDRARQIAKNGAGMILLIYSPFLMALAFFIAQGYGWEAIFLEMLGFLSLFCGLLLLENL